MPTNVHRRVGAVVVATRWRYGFVLIRLQFKPALLISVIAAVAAAPLPPPLPLPPSPHLPPPLPPRRPPPLHLLLSPSLPPPCLSFIITTKYTLTPVGLRQASLSMSSRFSAEEEFDLREGKRLTSLKPPPPDDGEREMTWRKSWTKQKAGSK